MCSVVRPIFIDFVGPGCYTRGMFVKLVCVYVLLFVVLPVPVKAYYIDPGSGSLLLQVLIGGLLGLALTIKLYWRKIKSRLRRLTGGLSEPDGSLPSRERER